MIVLDVVVDVAAVLIAVVLDAVDGLPLVVDAIGLVLVLAVILDVAVLAGVVVVDMTVLAVVLVLVD